MATHPCILAWRIPWTEEPSGLQSMGSQRVRRDWATQRQQEPLYTWTCPLAVQDWTKLGKWNFFSENLGWEQSKSETRSLAGSVNSELRGRRLPIITGGLGNTGAEGWLPRKDKAAAWRRTGGQGSNEGPWLPVMLWSWFGPRGLGACLQQIWWSIFARSMLFAQSFLTLCDPVVWPWDFPGKSTEVGCHSLLRGIFPTQGSNLSLLHCRWILCHWTTCYDMLSHSVVSDSMWPRGL